MPSLPIRLRLLDKWKQKRILGPSSPPGAPQTSGAGTSNAALAISEASTSAPSGANAMGLNAAPANSEPSRARTSIIGVSSVTESRMKTPSRECPDMPSSQAAVPPASCDSAATTSSQSPPLSTASTLTVIVETDRLAPSMITDPSSYTASNRSTPPSSTTPAPRDLWTEALHKLSSEDQQAVHRLQPKSNTGRPMSESIEELLGLTRKVQDDCQAKSSKFRFMGKDIIMRDVAGKIIFWLNKFKEVGDIAVNFDPIHASLPWAGVRFLLQAATSEHEQMGDLIMASEKLSCLITRGAICERLYPPGKIPADVLGNLQHSMVELYMAMLRTMALCHRLFVKNTAERAMHAILKPRDISALLKQCETQEVQVEYEAHNCERTRSQEADAASKMLLEILREPILRTDERVLSLLEEMDKRQCLEILDWTSKILYGSNHQTVKDERTPNTCQWLLGHSHYQEWQDASASIILWLYGTAGTGKTFLTSKVIDEIQAALRTKPNQEGFAFFYCNGNEAERREPLSVLRAFVRQLSTTVSNEHSIQKRLKAYYIESRLKASELNMKDCKSLLLEFVNVYPRTTLILDALDECEKHKRLELIGILDYLLAKASNPLKIFISSRPDGDITDKLKDRANIQINAKNNQDDISRFVKSEIVKHRRWDKMTPKLQSQIVETLQEQSQGMFQWAYLQIKQLLDLHRPSELVDRLGKLPKDLKNAYDEIYNGMSEVERKIADRAFQWVMCARKPLRTVELLPAVCQDKNSNSLMPLDGLDEGLLLDCCHNLLVIDPVRDVWVPSHVSVIEYFENHLWSQRQANCLVASVCLLLMQNTVLHDRERRWKRQEDSFYSGDPADSECHSASTSSWESASSIFAQEDPVSKEMIDLDDPLRGQGFGRLSFYARNYWMIHARNGADLDSNHRLSTQLEEFLGLPTDSSTAYRCWCRMVKQEGQGHVDPDVLHPDSIASFSYCAFGLAEVLPHWQDDTWEKDNIKTKQGATFLELAALSGSVPTCRDLIKHGADVNAQSNPDWGSALAAAAYKGEKDVVEFLVKEGAADVNMQLQYGNFRSALAAAVYKGEKDIVEFLVKEGGADVNMQLQHGRYGSALAVAAYGGRKDVVEFLVKEGGADVNMQLQFGVYRTALDAAERGHEFEMVQLLIKYGAKSKMEVEDDSDWVTEEGSDFSID